MDIARSLPSGRPTRLAPAGAALSIALAAGLAAWGTFGEESADAWEYLAVLGFIAGAAALVFGWAVPRGLRRESAGGTALALAVLGLLSIAVFWSGLPPVLAGGGLVLGIAGWRAARDALLCRVAAVVAAFALVGDVAVYVQDMAF
ncbi:MAG TPA: hypothetical protein VNJ53_12970 [Gaiellaceae bacterium]|nr:hypothetical protein [Gaiellaceae bacterium]